MGGVHEEVVVMVVLVVVTGHLVHVEARDDLLVLVVSSIGDDGVRIWWVVADVFVYVGAVRVQGSRVAGLDELGDAAGAADRDAEGQKVGPNCPNLRTLKDGRAVRNIVFSTMSVNRLPLSLPNACSAVTTS